MTGDDHREYSIMDCQFNFLTGWRYRLSHLAEMEGHCIHGVPEANLIIAINQKPKDMSKTKTVCFGRALEALKMGQKVFRSGWNGKGMWLGFVTENEALTRTGESWIHAPWIGMKTTDGKFVPWLCSQTDMIACDWCIMSEEEEYGVADRIPVPENIKFSRIGENVYLKSPNGKVSIGEYRGLPSVGRTLDEAPKGQAFLVPCKRSDLKPGDIAFRGITGAPPGLQEFTIHHQYCVILNEDESAYWYNEMDMKVDGICGGVFWYKVIFE